jgi:hypothetical protein
MGDRTTIPIAVLAVLVAAGCGPVGDRSATEQTTAGPAPSVRPTTVTPRGASATPSFRAATAEVTPLAAKLVQVVEYDTTREGKVAFHRGSGDSRHEPS